MPVLLKTFLFAFFFTVFDFAASIAQLIIADSIIIKIRQNVVYRSLSYII